MSSLKDKNIVLGVTGCIAVYKAAELVRLFVKAGANVDVIMTDSATEFVTPLTFSTLSKNKVYLSLFDSTLEYNIDHISLSDKADLLLIAPATANIIGKIANGIADDLLSTTVMATKSPVVIAPAMNVNMWENPIVQENILKLNKLGCHFINPDEGDLACGYKAVGRLKDIDSIFEEVNKKLNPLQPLKGKKVLVTVGGTREYIDPVRYITNKSSGKMGLAIAQEAISLGADVYIISTVDLPSINANITYVESAVDMQKVLNSIFPQVDILIMAAAVADYTVKDYSDKKIKKENNDLNLNIEMIKTPDLLKGISKKKKAGQLIVGFAAETDNLIDNAKSKLINKGLDLIVANDVSRSDIGMGSDYNEVSFIYPDSSMEYLTRSLKKEVAAKLFEIILKLS